MSHPALWIETDDGLRRVLDAVGAGPVAVDTEADSFHHYREKVCLLQLSWSGGDALVDPLAGADLRLCTPLFGDRGVVKVLHGSDYDLRILNRDYGLTFAGLFDTMVAARLVGETSYGLAALLDRFLGVALDKAHQRDDWSRRPLPTSMRDYAVADTRHLGALHRALSEKLRELGRTSWAAEEFLRLEGVRHQPNGGERTFRGVKGAATLDRRALEVLRALYGWRERVAASRDVPVFRVLHDETLTALAKARPKERSDLRGIPGFPRSADAARERGILEAIQEGEAVPEEDLPALPLQDRPIRDPALEARLKALRARRDAIATRLGIESSVLASRAVLEGVLRCVDRGEPIDRADGIRAWQAGLLREIVATS